MTLVFDLKDLERPREDANSDKKKKMLQFQRSTIADVLRASRLNDKEEEIFLEPSIYTMRKPAFQKSICFALPNLLNHWLKLPQDKLNAIRDAASLFQSASILVDDVLDNSLYKSGTATAISIYGVQTSLIAAIYALSISIRRILKFNSLEVTRIFSEHFMELCRGECLQIQRKNSCTCPSEAEQNTIIMQKNGGYCLLILGLMQQLSDYKKDLTVLCGILALYFQVRNDYFDCYSQKCTDDVGPNDDISEGYFNFLTVHAINSSPRGKEVLHIIKQKPKDAEMKRHCADLLKELGTYAYTRTVLKDLDKMARDEVERLGGNPSLIKLLDEFQDWKHNTSD